MKILLVGPRNNRSYQIMCNQDELMIIREALSARNETVEELRILATIDASLMPTSNADEPTV